MAFHVRPVLQAIALSAVEATAAADGWIVSGLDPVLMIVAAAGEGADQLLGRQLPDDGGSARFVIGSGQSVALTPRGAEDELGRSSTTSRDPSRPASSASPARPAAAS